jgi:DNA-binding transcriptional MocR family regulator
MPISKDEFQTIDGDTPDIDLAADTTQGRIYHFLLRNADKAFRQREIAEAVDVPQGSIGPTLARLEQHGLVKHRGRFWAITDAEHALASAGVLGASTADDRDGGFSNEEIETWMETAVDPIDEHDETNTSEEA